MTLHWCRTVKTWRCLLPFLLLIIPERHKDIRGCLHFINLEDRRMTHQEKTFQTLHEGLGSATVETRCCWRSLLKDKCVDVVVVVVVSSIDRKTLICSTLNASDATFINIIIKY